MNCNFVGTTETQIIYFHQIYVNKLKWERYEPAKLISCASSRSNLQKCPFKKLSLVSPSLTYITAQTFFKNGLFPWCGWIIKSSGHFRRFFWNWGYFNVRNFRVQKFSRIGPLAKFFTFRGNSFWIGQNGNIRGNLISRISQVLN